MKLFKNKKVVLASAIVLGVAAVTSSALAAYIITGATVDKESPVGVTEVDVVNNVVNLKVTGLDNATLVLQPEQQVSEGRVTTTGAGKMKLTFTLTMETESKELIPDITISVVENPEGTLVTGNYIALPTEKTLTKSDFGNGPFTTDVTLEWGWGSNFGNKAPTTYFNEGGDGASIKDDKVVETMTNFEKATVEHPGFTISFAKADAGE